MERKNQDLKSLNREWKYFRCSKESKGRLLEAIKRNKERSSLLKRF